MRFAYWGGISPGEKLVFLTGFTTGLFTGPRATGFAKFWDCLDKNVTVIQEIAMIDKYYEANPQRWSAPFSYAYVEAITVPDGPCAKINPWHSSR